MTDSEVTMKATPFLSVINYMNDRLPPSTCERLLDDMSKAFPQETRRVREKTILASERFPLRLATELIERMSAELHESPAAVAHQIGRRGADAATRGVLRFVFALLSISAYLSKIQPVWSQLYSHGRIKVETRDRSATVELDEFPFVSETNCARVTGSFEWYGQRAEKRAVVRHVACRAKGDPICRWTVDW